MDYQEYKKEFLTELRNESAISGSDTEDEFIGRTLDILSEFDEIEEPVRIGMGDKKGRGGRLMRADGYAFDETDHSLILLISDFQDSYSPENLNMSRVDELYWRLYYFLDESCNGSLNDYFDDSDDVLKIGRLIKNRINTAGDDEERILKVKFFILTNKDLGTSLLEANLLETNVRKSKGRTKKTTKTTKKIKKQDFNGKPLEINLWHLERFYEMESSNSSEPIVIDIAHDFPDLNYTGIPCIKGNVGEGLGYVGDCIDDWRLVNEYFAAKKAPEDIIKDFRESKYFVQYSVQELLRINYQNQKIFAEAVECTPNDTESRRKIWQDNPQIILSDGSFNPAIDAVRTITTKQDRNPNSGNLYFDSGIDGRSKFRYLTPRECLLFMGFTDEDYRKLKYNNIEFHKGDALFARDKIIRLAGNSIPVKLLEGVFYQILQIDDMLCSHPNRNKSVTVLFSPESSYSDIIRSYIFKRGIRSRITNEEHPKNATVIYPKYKTAIYVVGCEYQGDSIEGLCEQRYWQRRSDQMFTRAKQCCNEALNMGWNAIFVKNSELSEIRKDQTLPWIVDCLKKAERNEMQGGLIYYG